jgi:hypothetical protein
MIAARYFVVVGLIMTLLCASVFASSDGYCDPSDDVPQLEFTYSDGSSAFLKLTDTTIATSTVVTPEGMTHDSSVFSLGLDRMPTSINLHSNIGKFRVSISIKPSDPAVAGKMMKLHYGDYTENLFPIGGYSCTIPSSTEKWLSPNKAYATSLYVDDGTGTFVPYDPPSGLKVSMRWESSEDTRFAIFFSGNDVVGSRFYTPGEKLGEFPSTPESILPIDGWYDSLGKKVDSDTVYEYEGDMDFHTEYGFDISTLTILILLVLIIGICGVLITDKMD